MTDSPSPHLHLVVGFDGTPSARSALVTARTLTSGRGAELWVVYVSSPYAEQGFGRAELLDAARDNEQQIAVDLRAQARALLDDRAEQDWAFVHRIGAVAHELLAVAGDIQGEPTHPDQVRAIVVVGSTDRRRDHLLGSVPRDLTKQNHVAIAVVPARDE